MTRTRRGAKLAAQKRKDTATLRSIGRRYGINWGNVQNLAVNNKTEEILLALASHFATMKIAERYQKSFDLYGQIVESLLKQVKVASKDLPQQKRPPAPNLSKG